jgi:hypothetical protein
VPVSTGTGHRSFASPLTDEADTMKALFSYASSFRQRTVALFHCNDQLKADSNERRERWNQVIAEHRNPLQRQPPTSTSSVSEVMRPPSEAKDAPKERER